MSQTIPYDADRFLVRNMQQAKAIVLTPEDSTTEERWIKETPYLVDMIVHTMHPSERHRVLDFGCGPGRIAKSLITKTRCMVVGVDTSTSMRSLAPAYVLNDRFMACAPDMLDIVQPMHFALSIWALQHVPALSGSINLIHKKLASYGKLFVVNANNRCVPAPDGQWFDDKQDVRELLCSVFNEVSFGSLDPDKTTPMTSKASFWGLYERRT